MYKIYIIHKYNNTKKYHKLFNISLIKNKVTNDALIFYNRQQSVSYCYELSRSINLFIYETNKVLQI